MSRWKKAFWLMVVVFSIVALAANLYNADRQERLMMVAIAGFVGVIMALQSLFRGGNSN